MTCPHPYLLGSMVRASFSHVSYWVFDLDNTLYPREASLFDQIEVRMREYIVSTLGVTAARADELRDIYWRDHGTTLAGLMENHGIDPDPFLHDVHEIDLSVLTPAPDLRLAIDRLPGRKFIYTNGSRRHADRVLEARALTGVFDAIFGVEDADYHAKPSSHAFETVFGRAGLPTREAAMFEDDIRNLEVPHEMGMRTVLVGDEAEVPHVHHSTHDLAEFLGKVA